MKKQLFLLVLLVSCRNNIISEQNDKTSNEIIIETKLENKINISEIFSDVSYVKLESNIHSTIGSIGKMIVHDNKFYILDIKTSKILVFDLNGKYIFQISKQGRGPGEYLDVEDFLVDSVSNKIEILDDGNQKILIYDKIGNYLNERKHTFWADQFSKLSENAYLIFFNNYPNQPNVEESFNVLIVDSLFKVKNSFLPIGNLLGLKVGEQYFLQKYGSGVNVIIPYDNHIYHVMANNYSIKYTVNFINYVLPSSFLEEYLKVIKANNNSRTQALIQLIHKQNEGDYIVNLQNILENQKYLTFQYRISDKGTFTVILNKSTGKIHIGIAENDIDFGLYGIPLFILQDTLFTYFPAHELKERISSIDSKNLSTDSRYFRLKNLSESINENDNPIIAKFLLK